MSSYKRKRLFVDPAVQGAMVWRALIYWAACLLFITLPLVIGLTLSRPDKLFYEHLGDLWLQFGPVLTCALLVLPLLLYDLVRITNRFAGPMVRLRRGMQQLAEGKHVSPIQFRDNDFWHEFAEYFNRIAERVHREGDADGRETGASPGGVEASSPTVGAASR